MPDYRRFACAAFVIAALLLSHPVPAATTTPTRDQGPRSSASCLMFVARNLARGGGNFYIYQTFSREKLDLKKGDVLEYDIYLAQANPEPVGGIDLDTDKANLRDTGAKDQDGVRAHGAFHLDAAVGKWHHRRIPLDALANQAAHRWTIVFEGDKAGTYAQFVDDVVVTRADGSRHVIYDGSQPIDDADVHKEGYSRHILLKGVDRSTIKDGVDLSKMFQHELDQFALEEQIDELKAQIEVARKVGDREHNAHLQQHADEAARLVEKAEKTGALDPEGFQSLLHQVHASLNHDHPVMEQYTGHLVGHAHIDFQWLWEWPETVQVCHDTFNQALKFMDEFPGFKFSQSSTALYATTEEHFPEIFKGIQNQVACGNWEIVGGRVCEGDENMISPESHARHFLYGQRYFRERFAGKQAQVGWEPDTFGHTWQMPQMLKLAGMNYFYFCRGGHGKPLFWWQSPDGSKVLAFEEPATGGWYNGDVTMNRFDRILKWAEQTGTKDMLWVYGVGNHGGGPTRENIQAAIGFQKSGILPKVEFSTATEFFHQLEKYDKSKLPTVATDMNTTANAGFFGVFTTHSDIKRWNRDAEATTESAEAIAALASRYGFGYPAKEFRRNWEDICWNHHHDTLPGTSIHPSYNKSEAMYKRATESSRKIGDDALTFLASKVKADGDGVLVFNPTGFTRDGIIDVPPTKNALAVGDDWGLISGSGNPRTFYVKDLPPYGYRRYSFADRGVAAYPQFIRLSPDRTQIENEQFRVTIDPARGVVTSVFDKKANREAIAPGGSGNRLEIHWEQPNGMSAWSIGKIDRVEPLVGPVELKTTEQGDNRVTVSWDRTFQSTILHQSVTLPRYGPPEFAMATEWKELGAADKPCPFLKVAFDVNADQPKLTCQIPYGTIEKPTDGGEVPALKFADLADTAGGAALINDCKHGYSATGNTLRLSLIRSSYYPDPHPNDRPQSAKWVFLPHKGDWRDGHVLAAAETFNHPLWATAVKSNPAGTLPPESSLLQVTGGDDIVVTGLKRAEDDDDLVVRFYESDGKSAKPALRLPWQQRNVTTVNFIEDALKDAKPLAELRPHEIRTIKIATGPTTAPSHR